MRRRVVILGIDSVHEKVLHQTRWLSERGWVVDVLSMQRSPLAVDQDPSCTIVRLHRGGLARSAQVLRHLWRHRSTVHHAELYVAGRFAPVHAVLCRLLRIPVLAVERGDLFMVQRRNYDATTRAAIKLSYRLSNRIWFKEPFMERGLAELGVGQRSRMLPNAVPVASEVPTSARDVDVLWANRLIPERHPDWLVAAWREHGAGHRAMVMGFTPEGGDPYEPEARVRDALDHLAGVELLAFDDPHPWYARSRYFWFVADFVFANFALLEAMAAGVVPIVSDVEGTELLVEDGRNGIVVDLSVEGATDGLRRALALSEDERDAMAAAARSTIVDRYSLDAWGDRLLAIYDELRPPTGSGAAG